MDLEKNLNNYHSVALSMLRRTNSESKPCKHFQLSMAMLKKKKKKITQRYNTKELFLEKALKDTDLSDFKMI